ncbi:MAG: hypothetical protein ACI4BD_01955 [Paludibacteraceae bacterium]
MKKVLLYCVCWLAAGTAAAQTVDGITGASTRVLAPADSSATVVIEGAQSPDRTIKTSENNTGDTLPADSLSGAEMSSNAEISSVVLLAADSDESSDRTSREAGGKQARKRTVTVQAEVPEPSPKKGRLAVGGYGEATMKRCFYSNNYLRYTSPENYANDQYGEFDLPHVVIYLGYDFGKGWSMGSEIEFEHGGTEVAVEIEEEEGGEYETEVERGGEVALEQFWIQKSFNPYANLRMGMIIVPLGGTNAHHEPNQFFGVYRPEGDNTILPCTWHDIGVQFHGRYKWFGYTAQFLPGLESTLFSKQNWIQGGSASAYEFKLANCYAGLARLDFYPLYGGDSPRRKDRGRDARVSAAQSDLRLSVSGYAGTSFRNNLTPTTNSKYDGVKGLVSLVAFDWNYTGHGVIFRGSATYGHLGDAALISAYNKSMSKNSISKRENVASDAYTAGAEIGYDIFHSIPRIHDKRQSLYLFARYDAYDAQARIEGTKNYWTGRQKVSCGLNYLPVPEVIIKGEFGYGILNQNPYSATRYNNEPYVALSVNYCGFFVL